MELSGVSLIAGHISHCWPYQSLLAISVIAGHISHYQAYQSLLAKKASLVTPA
jgi:hypothetical protein